jgi:chaperone BCS1
MEILNKLPPLGGNISPQLIFTTIIGLYGITISSFLFRGIPGMINSFFWRHFSTSLFISSDESCFDCLIELLLDEKITDKSRHIRFITKRHSSSKITKSIGIGSQLYFFRGQPLWISYTLSEKINGDKNYITLTKVGRSHRLFDQLKDALIEISERVTDPNKITIFRFDSESERWRYKGIILKRSFDTIFVSDDIKNKLVNHLSHFYSSGEWYHSRGIPYHTGILLYGEPGTGKTSLIKSLASYYNKKICILSAKDLDSLFNALDSVPENGIVVIEDIDTNASIQQRNENSNDSEHVQEMQRCLSDILNAMDGIISTEERVLVLTTNHIEKLDKAFIRPGRIDLAINISYVSINSFKDFVKVFYKDSLDADILDLLDEIKEIKEVTVAQLQNDFMTGLDAAHLIRKWCVCEDAEIAEILNFSQAI